MDVPEPSQGRDGEHLLPMLEREPNGSNLSIDGVVGDEAIVCLLMLLKGDGVVVIVNG